MRCAVVCVRDKQGMARIWWRVDLCLLGDREYLIVVSHARGVDNTVVFVQPAK